MRLSVNPVDYGICDSADLVLGDQESADLIENAATLLEAEKWEAARDLLLSVKASLPAEARRLLALAYRWNGQMSEAVQAAASYAHKARQADAYMFWLVTAIRAESWAEGLTAADILLKFIGDKDPESRSKVISFKATIFEQNGDRIGAMAFGEELIEEYPDNENAYVFYLRALLDSGQVQKGRRIAADFCRRFPESPGAWNMLAGATQNCGRIEEALIYHRRSYEKSYEAFQGSNILYALQFKPSLSQAESDRKHVAICEELWPGNGNLKRSGTHWPWDGKRRLRIGYISADFRAHSVSYFSEMMIEKHDRKRFEVFCYYNNNFSKPMTKVFKEHTDHWREIYGRPDDEVAAMISADCIDILVDLGGHTGNNRLGVFAKRPAPVQVTWLGYPDITGLAAMDARICDAVVDPVSADGSPQRAISGERLIRLPHGYHCWRPMEGMPEVAPDPSGIPMFGCCGSLAKINPLVLDLWAEILRQAPHAGLMIKTGAMGSLDSQNLMREEFERRGANSERLVLHGAVIDQAEHMAVYGLMHLALDTFPYNGTTTICEALWMGVPVLTLRGERRVARVGESLLTALGEGYAKLLVAQSPSDYVDRAVTLINDIPYLNKLRRSIRPRMMASPLRDEDGFIRIFEDALCKLTRDLASG
jgi:tetratricopeptide (TPR) repeat protein